MSFVLHSLNDLFYGMRTIHEMKSQTDRPMILRVVKPKFVFIYSQCVTDNSRYPCTHSRFSRRATNKYET